MNADDVRAVFCGVISGWVFWTLITTLMSKSCGDTQDKEVEVAYRFYRELYLKAAEDAGYPEGHEKAAVEACLDRVEKETGIRYLRNRIRVEE